MANSIKFKPIDSPATDRWSVRIGVTQNGETYYRFNGEASLVEIFGMLELMKHQILAESLEGGDEQ